MIQHKTNPTRPELRQFAGIWWPLFRALVAWWLWPAEGPPTRSLAVVGGGLAIGLVDFLWPPFIRPLFLGLIYLTAPIGWTVSHAVLALVYYAVLTPVGPVGPVGLVMHLFGRSPVPKIFDRNADSYWVCALSERTLKSYFQQY